MKLYWKYAAILLKSQMQYKASFFMTAAGQFLVSFSALLGVSFLFDRFHTVDGFTFPEVLICFSIVLATFSFSECFARGFDAFPRLIQSGKLDQILTRPRGVVFQVLTANMEFSRAGRLAQSILVLCYAVPHSGIDWTAEKILCACLMLIGGVAVFSSLFVLYAGFSFFTIERLEFMNIFTDGMREFGTYPLSVYGGGVLKFFTFVIPVALFQYYPLLYLTGKSQERGFLFLPLLAFVFFLPCYAFFRFGLHHYQSTGS